MNNIDLVIPWVDGSDPEWQAQKSKYLKRKSSNDGFYRDNGLLRYWFRSVEKNMPWIRNLFFVTYGHLPDWLNTAHPKLRIINHADYLLPEFLPTFSVIPINLNLHRIEGLSEHFIYAEDDIFFVGKQRPEDFFSDEGIPKDFLWLMPVTEQFSGDFIHIMLNNVMFLNKHFDMQSCMTGMETALFSDAYPGKVKEENKKYLSLTRFPGFKETHLAYPLLKSSFEELWKKDTMSFYTTSMHKFRSVADINIALIRDYQLVKGKFEPFYPQGRYFRDTASQDIIKLLLDENTSMICINESNNAGYSEEKEAEICSCFEKRFPEASSFELR